MKTPNVFIGGIGSFIPELMSVETAIRKGDSPVENMTKHKLEGAAVAGEIPAPEMGLRAAKKAVERSGCSPDQIDLLLYASSWHQGPAGWLPHSYLQHYLLGGGSLAVELREGCSGMFAALELAAGYIQSIPDTHGVLTVAADNFGTPTANRWLMGHEFVHGDAAAAVVLTKVPSFAQLLAVSSISVPEGEVLARGGEPLFPPCTTGYAPALSERFTKAFATPDPQIEADISSALDKVPSTIKDIAERTLDEAGIGVDDVTYVTFINCSKSAVERRCMAPLGMPMSKAIWELGLQIGHCGASDQVLDLEHLMENGRLNPGDHLFMFGGAPGFLFSAAVVKILDVPEWASRH